MMVATEAAAGLKLYCRGGEGCCGREAERLCGAGEGDCDHDDQVTHSCRAGNEPLKFNSHGEGSVQNSPTFPVVLLKSSKKVVFLNKISSK